LISSLCIVVLVVLLSRVITGTIDPVSLIFNILTNLTLLATLGYVLALLMLSWIKSTVEGEPVLTEQSKRVESFLDFSEERTWLQFGFYMLNLIISVLFITLVIVFRSSLILSANIVASATGLLERGVLILLMFGLDLAYLGLVLVLVGQLYETGKSLRRL